MVSFEVFNRFMLPDTLFLAQKIPKLKVTNLRMKGAMTGDGANVRLDRLYYLSVHTLDNSEGVRYAKNRVARELTDLWIDKKISFGGISFNDASEDLTEDDPRQIFGTFLQVVPISSNLSLQNIILF